MTNINAFSSEQIETNEEIKGTPFRIIGGKEVGYMAVLGRYAITSPMEDIFMVQEYIYGHDGIPWDAIINVILAAPQILAELNNTQKTEE